MAVKNYSELIVWQKAVDLVEMVYRATCAFPKEETYGLKMQSRRAAVSIPSNIAEGQGRQTTREFLYFLSVANGSLKELETQMVIARRLDFLGPPKQTQILELTAEVGRLIKGLTRSLQRK